MQYLSQDEIRATLDKAAGENSDDYVLLTVLLQTGLRASELISLTPYHVLKDALNVKGKGLKYRMVDISPVVQTLLASHIRLAKLGPADKLFKMDRSNLYRLCKYYSGKNPHAFRHTYAINLLRETKNVRFVQKQLGHSSLRITEKYLQFAEYDIEKSQLPNLYRDKVNP